MHQICYTLRRHPDAPSYQFSAFSPPRFARESRNHFPRAQGSLEGGISGEKTGSKSRVEKERGKSSFHRKNFFVCEPICTKFATRLEEAQTHLPTNFQLSPFLGSPARAETTLPRAQAGLGAGFSGKALGKRGSTEPTVERRGKSRISWEPPNGSS